MPLNSKNLSVTSAFILGCRKIFPATGLPVWARCGPAEVWPVAPAEGISRDFAAGGISILPTKRNSRFQIFRDGGSWELSAENLYFESPAKPPDCFPNPACVDVRKSSGGIVSLAVCAGKGNGCRALVFRKEFALCPQTQVSGRIGADSIGG